MILCRFFRTITKIIYENGPILFFPAAYILFVVVLQWFLGRDNLLEVYWGIDIIDSLVPGFLCIGFLFLLLEKIPEMKNIGLLDIYLDIKDSYLTFERIIGFFLVYITFAPFFSTFSSYKLAIPSFQSFEWDLTLMEIDRFLHFGNLPWELIHDFLSVPVFTKIIDTFYSFWFFLVFFVATSIAFSRNPRLRLHFFISFFSTWIVLGTAMATVLFSAGPCYYGRIVGGYDPFAPLMNYLELVHRETYPLFAIISQKALWDAYKSGIHMSFGGGISAMPSLHVAMAVLCALVVWKINRFIGGVLWGYAIIILIGSVHLGWHYAVDGYISIIVTIIIWTGVGRIMKTFGPSVLFEDLRATGSEIN